MNQLRITKTGARLNGIYIPCAIGRGGIGTKRGEGDGITPTGQHELTQWLHRPDRLELMGSKATRHHEAWSDDAADPAYNQICRWGTTSEFNHERLHRADPLYDLIGVLNYNRDPIVPGAGSAIFLHIWRKPRHPTEGCIAFARQNLIWLQTQLPPGSLIDVSP